MAEMRNDERDKLIPTKYNGQALHQRNTERVSLCMRVCVRVFGWQRFGFLRCAVDKLLPTAQIFGSLYDTAEWAGERLHCSHPATGTPEHRTKTFAGTLQTKEQVAVDIGC